MSHLLILAMAVAAPAADPSGSVSTTPLVEPAEQIEILAPHELRKAAGEALRRQAVEKNEKQHAAVRDLVIVYKQLQADRRMATGERERLLDELLRADRGHRAAFAEERARDARLAALWRLALARESTRRTLERAGK